MSQEHALFIFHLIKCRLANVFFFFCGRSCTRCCVWSIMPACVHVCTACATHLIFCVLPWSLYLPRCVFLHAPVLIFIREKLHREGELRTKSLINASCLWCCTDFHLTVRALKYTRMAEESMIILQGSSQAMPLWSPNIKCVTRVNCSRFQIIVVQCVCAHQPVCVF